MEISDCLLPSPKWDIYITHTQAQGIRERKKRKEIEETKIERKAGMANSGMKESM